MSPPPSPWDAVSLALVGGLAGVALAGAWLWRFEQALNTSCDLGCVVFLPLFPALGLAGAFAGAVTGRQGWQATKGGWWLLVALAVAALVFPQALGWVLITPLDLVGFNVVMLVVGFVLWAALPAAAFWGACRVARWNA